MVQPCVPAPANGCWWFSRALFAAQRNLNLYVDPLAWDNGVTVEPTGQCSFVQILVAMLIVLIKVCSGVLSLLSVRAAAAMVMQFLLLALGNLVAVNDSRTKQDRTFAAGMLVFQTVVLLPAVLLLAVVYASVAWAAWLCVFKPALDALTVVGVTFF